MVGSGSGASSSAALPLGGRQWPRVLRAPAHRAHGPSLVRLVAPAPSVAPRAAVPGARQAPAATGAEVGADQVHAPDCTPSVDVRCPPRVYVRPLGSARPGGRGGAVLGVLSALGASTVGVRLPAMSRGGAAAARQRSAGKGAAASSAPSRAGRPKGAGSAGAAGTARPGPLVQAAMDATDRNLPAADRLIAARSARQLLDAAELDAWQGCRAEGLSWGRLASLTRMGRSGAQQRLSKLSERLGT